MTMTTSGAGAPAPAPLAIAAGAAPATPAGRGGRRTAAATVNPRSVADFEDVTGILLFLRDILHVMMHMRT